MPKTFTTLFTVGLLLLCQVSVSHAAEDIFLLIPGIPGEVVNTIDPIHNGWSRVLTVDWGHGDAPPSSPTRAQFRRVAITKLSDSTSAPLALFGATGQPINEVQLEITRNAVAWFHMRLTNARVVSYTASSSASLSSRIEGVSFSFDTILWDTIKINPDGSRGTKNTGCFDVVNNKVC